MSDIKFVDKQESINPITQFGEYLYNRLPKVYRDYDVEIERLNVETQKKETFKTLKEYLYSFALGGFQPLLEDLEAIISLVDPFKCPSEFLPYLLRHFGLDYIDDIPEKFQRRLVQNVVTLYKKKGTIPAVAFLAKELSGFGVTIEEKSDGSVEFALIKMNAYEDEDAELLLAQDVVQRYIHLFLPAQTKSKVIVVYGFTENIHINYPDFRINFVADSVDCIDVTMRNAKDLSGMFIYYISGNQGDWSENNVISYSDISSSSEFATFSIPIDRAEHNFTGNINSIKLVFVNKENTSDNKVEIKSIKFLDNEPNSHTVFELNANSSLYAGDNTKIIVEDSSLSVTYSGFRGYVYNQLGNTKYDHVYYNVDEYEDITYIDENGYDSKTGGYSEAFDYLKHIVEDDFNALKLKLEEENHNFSPSLSDLTSLTNCVENDGLPMFTNGISCEDTITEHTFTSSTGEVEVTIPASSSSISVNKLVGGGDYAVLPIYKCTTDLTKGTTLEFKYDGKSYGYYTLERDLYASENFPTTFQLDIYNNMVRVYNHYFTETIDESYDFTLFSGYDSYYTTMRNGFVATDFVDDIRIICDYTKSFTKMDSIYFQPTTTPQIAFYQHDVYISLSDTISSAESAKEFVKNHPITLIAPSAKSGSGTGKYTSLCGQTIAYKKLSDTPINNSTIIECAVYTMDDRKTVFAYESPVFVQNSNITINGDYGIKIFPETEATGETIRVSDHLNGADIPDYKVYGNSFQATRSGKNLIPYPYSDSTKTLYGITFTDNNGVITLDGTTTLSETRVIDFRLMFNAKFEAGTYTLSGCPKTGATYTYRLFVNIKHNDNTYAYANDLGNGSTFTVTDTDLVTIAIRIGGQLGTVSNLVFKPQLELGSTATEYEPYGIMPSPEFPSEIQSVGDLTKNLLPYPYVGFGGETTQTVNGVTFTDNGDGSITVDGTATAVTAFLLANNSNLTIKPNTTYTLSGFDELNVSQADLRVSDNLTTAYMVHRENTSAVFQYSNTDGVYIQILIRNGTVCDNLIFKPQLELGSTATEYEPYHKYDIPITVAGKNLIPYPYIYTTTTINGVTFTDNGDGSITVNGTATANAVFYLVGKQDNYTLDKCGLKIGDSYTISKTPISGDSIANVYFTANYYDENGSMKAGASISNINTETATIQSDFVMWGIYLLVLKDKTVNNTTIKLQLEKGSSATEYEPYRGNITSHIYLDEPLRKIGDYADYIDFKNQKVIRNIKEVTFDGTENWGYRDTDNIIYLSINNLASSVYCYSTHFLSEALKDTISPYFRPVTGILRLYQRSNNIVYSSADEFKTFLENQNTAGTPLIVDYILTTPTEEPISLPTLTAPNSTVMNISLETSVQPSLMDIVYLRNESIPQNSDVTYDLGIPLVSFDGYNESIEKIDGKYYLRSAIKELDLFYMYDNKSDTFPEIDSFPTLWFDIIGNSNSEETPFYFNMSPCKYDVEYINTYTTDGDGNNVALPNYADTFDFMCFYYAMGGSSLNQWGSVKYYKIVSAGEFKHLNGKALKAGLDTFKAMYDNLFRYSDIPPKFYIYDKYKKYGGETLTEITDKEVINKLNLLPIPENYAIISSKGIKYSYIDVSVQSKRYY